MARSSFQGLIAIATVFITLAFSFAYAGECKVKEPTEAAIADAIKVGVVLELQMEELSKEYLKKTGKQLKVALVSRAGQNMKDITTLKEADAQGRLLNLQQIVQTGEAEAPMTEAGTKDPETVKNAIRKLYGDKSRQSVYSHMGMIFRNHPQGKDEAEGQNQWWFRHMLRPCATKEDIQSGVNPNMPELYDEGVLRFFADDPYELRAQIIVPPSDIQDNLEKLALPKLVKINGEEYWDNRLPQIFKGEFYNAAAGWKNQTEANSNQYILELVAAASQPFGRVRTRAEAQDVLVKSGYRPMRAILSGMQAMAGAPFASKFAPYVRLHDEEQPAYRNYSIADLITTLSVEEYMQRNGWVVLNKHIHVTDKSKFEDKSKTTPTRDY